MTEADDLLREIWSLREMANRGWKDVSEMALTDKERAALRLQLKLAIDDLEALLMRIDESEHANRT